MRDKSYTVFLSFKLEGGVFEKNIMSFVCKQAKYVSFVIYFGDTVAFFTTHFLTHVTCVFL